MLGLRLAQADHIAERRQSRRGLESVPANRFRKFNGCCSCWACRGPRYGQKGDGKRREMFLRDSVENS